MKRDQLVTAIRTQLDLDEEDLPLVVAQTFLRDAFYRTAARERRWPSMESTWEYVITAGEQKATLASDTAEIKSVVDLSTVSRLAFADHDLIRDAKGYFSASATMFSLWAGDIYIWPSPPDDLTIEITGYRRPSTTWLDDPGLEVDLDERLHLPMMHYAIALAYAQQEDGELEQMYMNRWFSGLEDVHKDIMKAGVYRPIVLNGGLEYA